MYVTRSIRVPGITRIGIRGLRSRFHIVKCLITLTIIILISAILAVFCEVVAQDKEQAKTNKVEIMTEPPKILAIILYPPGELSRQLTIWKRELPPLEQVDLINYLLSHPEANSFPNVLFMLVDSSTGDPSGKVVWVSYDSYEKWKGRWPIWSADVVWHPIRREAYVVLVKSINWHITLSVYRVDPNQSIATYPLELDPKKYEEWPKPLEPISQIQKKLLDKKVSDIGRIDIITQRDDLLIYAEREQKDSPPVYFRFNLETREWSEVTLQEIKVQSGNPQN